jgi:hypothetical protein
MPPNTADYLQRIGWAGRATGTALIVSVVNQRPHDLFFSARPSEMLRGRVDPPGCWLHASAVLVRQYLGYCFDRATRAGALGELPRHGGQLIADLNNGRFEIQQIAIGNPQQPLIETWALCGVCGRMRRAEELHQPGMAPSCPQCGHDGDQKSQLDLGQQRAFLEFPR